MTQPLPLPEKLEAFGKRIRLRHIAAGIIGVTVFAGIISALPSFYEDKTSIFPEETLAYIEGDLIDDKEQSAGSILVSEAQKEAERASAPERTIEMAVGPYPYDAVIYPVSKPKEVTSKRIIRSGETLAGFLTKNGLSTSESYAAIEAFKKEYDPRNVRAGEKFSFDMVADDEGNKKLLSLEYSPSIIETITVARNADGDFVAGKHKKELTYEERALSFTVQNSLYGSGALAGVPDSVIMDLIRIYSWKLDFQRDVRSGDQIKVFYEAETTEDGISTNNYKIHYAAMTVDGTEIPIYRHEDEDGIVDFFMKDGKSIRQGLLKTPIAFGRISSGYGKRKHPILGYNKMHKGVDFAAPRGTAIYAAADGVIEKKYYSSSYGNYIRIRHASGIKTAYAHMKNFAKDVGNGTRVKQGQTIGYVGTTGRSTGPHLHYEVLKNGVQVNPKSVDLPTQNELKGQDLKEFKSFVANIERKFKNNLDESGMMLAQHNEE